MSTGKSRLFCALDLGGTKTDAVLFTEKGEIISHIIDPGGTPIEIGAERSVNGFCGTVEKLLSHIGNDTEVEMFYGAVACSNFCHDMVVSAVSGHFPQIKETRIEGDGPILISGMLGHRDGACLICGTGASVCVRTGEEYHFIGGWGYLIDSCGSGYVLGRNAIQRALRAYDGRQTPTALYDIISRRCGEPVQDHIYKFYNGGRSYIASMAAAVFEARNAGDEAAAVIFNEGVRDLSDIVFAAYRETGHPFDIVFNGGIFTHFPEYAEAVKSACPPDVHVIMSDVPPVYGGAVEAMYYSGLATDINFKNKFMHGYTQSIA